MPSEEFMERAQEVLYGRHERGFIMKPLIDNSRDKVVLERIATALESADASGYARGRAEAVEECARVASQFWKHRPSQGAEATHLVGRGTQELIVDAIRSLSQKDTRHE